MSKVNVRSTAMGKKTRQSKEVYNKMARGYDTSPEGEYTKAHKAVLIQNVELEDGDRILDVACGNGTLLAALAEKADVEAFGIDISKNMIVAAKQRYPEGTFRVQPSVPLDFKTESLDAITVSCAFHHFEDPWEFAAECMRALKKGGAVYLAEPSFKPMVRWIANRMVFPWTHTGDVRVYSPKELSTFFEKAGFTEIRTETWETVLFLEARK